MSEFKGFLFTGTKTRLLKVLFCCCGFAWSPAFWTIIYNFTVGKTLSLTWVGWISSFLVLHLLYFTAAADSSVFTVRLLKMSLQLQGAQWWISYGRASAGRKTFTCRSRVGRTSGRQTKRQSAPANAALESRWLPHTHTPAYTPLQTQKRSAGLTSLWCILTFAKLLHTTFLPKDTACD